MLAARLNYWPLKQTTLRKNHSLWYSAKPNNPQTCTTYTRAQVPPHMPQRRHQSAQAHQQSSSTQAPHRSTSAHVPVYTPQSAHAVSPEQQRARQNTQRCTHSVQQSAQVVCQLLPAAARTPTHLALCKNNTHSTQRTHISRVTARRHISRVTACKQQHTWRLANG